MCPSHIAALLLAAWLHAVLRLSPPLRSAPELPLYNDGRYEFSIDIWAAGCVMAEMLGMTAAGIDRKNRLPLFPGTSCLPLSRGTSIGARG